MGRRALLAANVVKEESGGGDLFPISLNFDETLSIDLFNELWDYICRKGENLAGNYRYVFANEEMTIIKNNVGYKIVACDALHYWGRALTFYTNTDFTYPYFSCDEDKLKWSFED